MTEVVRAPQPPNADFRTRANGPAAGGGAGGTAKAVLDAAPESGRQGAVESPGATGSAWRCPECLAPVRRTQRGQLFCCPKHKRAYNNRWLARGGVAAPLVATARITRNGTRGDCDTGQKASRDANFLVQKWRDEDAAAGRMPVEQYVAERYRLWLVDVVQ